MVPGIIDVLSLILVPKMKLDSGDENQFRAINQPGASVYLDDILDGLPSMKHFIIQSSLIDGNNTNGHGQAYEHWKEKISKLHPSKVHIYSTERITSQSGLMC